MREIKLTRNKVALVDDKDYEWLNQWKWCAVPGRNGSFYAKRAMAKNERGYCNVLIIMHRIILGVKAGLYVDHIDGNGLNNQRNNLRICTNQQNIRNRAINKNNKTGYKGVYYSKTKSNGKTYVYISAYIKVNNKSIALGHFKSLVDAAEAYDKAATMYFGEFANLNL